MIYQETRDRIFKLLDKFVVIAGQAVSIVILAKARIPLVSSQARGRPGVTGSAGGLRVKPAMTVTEMARGLRSKPGVTVTDRRMKYE